MKVVLANSACIDSKGYYIIHSPSRWSEGIRDRYNWFSYYPWELAYCSSLLKRETSFEIKLLDGCLKRLNYFNYLKIIEEEEPDWLIMESSSRTILENLKIAKAIKEDLGTQLIFVGQHASAFPEELIKEGVDYVCIGEYEFTVLEILQERERDKILGLYSNKRRPLLDIRQLPWPEDGDVRRIDYGRPGEPSSEYLEVQMYASRGCLNSCSFCVARHIYYGQPNWRARDISDIISEIKYLKEKYPGMEGIFFDEEAHNGNKEFLLNLTSAIIKNRLENLHFEAMCNFYSLDQESLEQMKEAGYYKLRFGIESGSKKVCKLINKNINLDDVIIKLRLIKKIGLKTYGTFMIGARGSTKSEDLKTIRLIKCLVEEGFLDNVQISIATPYPGTPFYKWVKENNFLVEKDFSKYDGGNYCVISYPDYSKQEVESMKKLAFNIRDHATFYERIKTGKGFYWFKSVFKKRGFFGSLTKLIMRLILELRYQCQKYQLS